MMNHLTIKYDLILLSVVKLYVLGHQKLLTKSQLGFLTQDLLFCKCFSVSTNVVILFC